MSTSSAYRGTLTRYGREGFGARVEAAWQSLRSNIETPTPFSNLRFAAIFGEAMGFTPAIALAEDDLDRPAAGALIYGSGVGPYNQALVPPFVQYTPLFSRSHSLNEEDLQASLAVLKAIRSTFAGAALHTLPGLSDTRFATWDGWTVSPLYTYRLELGALPDVQRGWSEGTRRTFRKHAPDFKIEESPTVITDVVALCRQSYNRHNRRLPAREAALINAAEALAREGLASAFVATPRGKTEPAAGLVVLNEGDSAHYWIAGSQPGPAMTVLLGEVLQRLSTRGIRIFDFVGANTPSIAEFKRRFGPTLVTYYRFERVSAQGLRMINWLRRIRRR